MSIPFRERAEIIAVRNVALEEPHASLSTVSLLRRISLFGSVLAEFFH